MTSEQLRQRIITAAGAQCLNLMMMTGEKGIDLLTPSQTLEIVAEAFFTMREAMEDEAAREDEAGQMNSRNVSEWNITQRVHIRSNSNQSLLYDLRCADNAV